MWGLVYWAWGLGSCDSVTAILSAPSAGICSQMDRQREVALLLTLLNASEKITSHFRRQRREVEFRWEIIVFIAKREENNDGDEDKERGHRRLCFG